MSSNKPSTQDQERPRGRSPTPRCPPGQPPQQTDGRPVSPESDRDTTPRPPPAKARRGFRRRSLSHNADADKQAEEEIARRRMEGDYPIVAALTTSAPIADAQTLLALSSTLSTLYNRPEASITLSIFQTPGILHAQSFAPSYTLTLTLPTPLSSPTTNDRHAASLAACLREELDIPPARGTILFVPLHEGCIAVEGRTLKGVYSEDVYAAQAARIAREARTRIADMEERERAAGGRKRSFASLRRLYFRKGGGWEVTGREGMGAGSVRMMDEVIPEEAEGWERVTAGGEEEDKMGGGEEGGEKAVKVRRSLGSIFFAAGG
ncbi:hypothetical protein VE03_03318 [Pseudogymnoascus sp. 23342-1-I1]|nr:hypothetical protein VE03_03318 [Pseudogymnoascus sp. 23342-1-I1]